MATMTFHEPSGARAFTVPIDQTIPGGPFHGRAELVIETAGADDQPRRLALRFFPSEFEFQAKLAQLIAEGGFDVPGAELSRRAAALPPVVTYEADPTPLPSGLSDLAALEGYLATTPPTVFDLTRYRVAEIAFG